jgi:hypothetical protein
MRRRGLWPSYFHLKPRRFQVEVASKAARMGRSRAETQPICYRRMTTLRALCSPAAANTS